MRLSTIAVGLTSLLSLTSAAPLQKRALSEIDAATLQLALYLEHLEFTLYSGGYNNFSEAQYEADGFPPGFRDNVKLIADHEADHIKAITDILTSNGVEPVPNCTYHFDMSTSPKTFVSLANMITTVGIGAYLGGAANLVDNPYLLTAASSILSVEARHDAILRSGLGAIPFPQSFETPLTAIYAFSAAQMFVVSCPQQLPIVTLPALKLVAPIPPINLRPEIAPGTVLTFSWDPSQFFVPVDENAPLYVAFVNQAPFPPKFAPVTKTGTGTGTVVLPEGLLGAAFAVLSTFSGGLDEIQLSQFGTLAGPAEVLLS